MIIKKLLCILLSVSFLIVQAVQAENMNTKISFAVVDDGDEILFSTSLLSDRKIKIIHPDAANSKSVFSLIRPDTLPRLLSCFRDAILDANKQKAFLHNGFYVGDLFEQASVKEYIELDSNGIDNLCNDMALRFQKLAESDEESVSDTDNESSIEYVLRLFVTQLFDRETTACISTYDRHYITVDIVRRQKTVISLSADFSADDLFIILIGHRAGDAIYYEEITCKSNNDETDYSFCLYRTETPAFRMVGEQDCLQFADIRCNETDMECYTFNGEIQSVLFPSTANLKGSRITGENKKGIIQAEMEILGNTQETIDSIFTVLYSILQQQP